MAVAELVRGGKPLSHQFRPVLVARHEDDGGRLAAVDGALGEAEQPQPLARHLRPALVRRAGPVLVLARGQDRVVEGGVVATRMRVVLRNCDVKLPMLVRAYF